MATYRFTNETSVGVSLLLNERPIYGSSRLGSYVRTMQLYNAQAITSYPPPSNIIQRSHLRYELTDHLGNVAAVVTGRLLPSQSLAPYEADLVSAQGYEPFGSLLPGRNFSSDSYRFGFQGQEKDDEINGSVGTSYAFEYRVHDPRIGRFLSIDPLAAKYTGIAPYVFVSNNPNMLVDRDGRELFLGGHMKRAFRDVRSLVKKEFRSRLSYDKATGLVSFNRVGLQPTEFDEAGLKLVNDLVVSKKVYQYSVSNVAQSKNQVTGEIRTQDLRDHWIGVSNVSKTPRLEVGGGREIPANDRNDAEVTIRQVLLHDEEDAYGNVVRKDRAATVFHELQKSYERTDNELPYVYQVPGNPAKEDPTRKGAHEVAIDKENKFYRRSNMPGEIINPERR